MDRLLSVEADLTATVDGQEVEIDGYGDRVVVSFPSFRIARRTSEGAGVDVDVRIRGASVARLGPGVRAGLISRLVGAAPARVSVIGVLRALF